MVAYRIYARCSITKRIEVLGQSCTSQSLPAKHVDIYHVAPKSEGQIRVIGHVYCELELFGRFQINDVHLESLAAKVPCKGKCITWRSWRSLSQKLLVS